MNEQIIPDAWVKINPDSHARMRLFCFPFAGGGASSYLSWRGAITSDIEICPIQLPGRENRLHEKPFLHMEPLVTALGKVLRPYMNMPFAFYGHSMGAIISFALARHLRQQHGPTPLHLFVSAHHAPQLPNPNPAISHLADSEFIEHLRHFNGTPEAILNDPDMMRFLLPLLRADLAIYETYTYVSEHPLICPISAFGGTRDSRADRASLGAWEAQTQSTFSLHMYPGNHFFIQPMRKTLLQDIHRALIPALTQIKHSI